LLARLSAGGPASIAGLTAGSRVTRQAVTKHLRVLAAAGLTRGRRRGREQLWELRPEPLQSAHAALDQISRQWDAALLRLRAFLEDSEDQDA
jgi:DNA-binding transcriptional ArsR family regulator